MRTIIEPFRIKAVEPIRMTSPAERREILERTGFNLFAIRAEDVIIDLLTDSGVAAMSAEQWAALMRGDESYAGSASFERFEAAVKRLMPFKHVIPTHQGRAAEAILFALLGGEGRMIPRTLISIRRERTLRPQARWPWTCFAEKQKSLLPTHHSKATWTSNGWSSCCAPKAIGCHA